MNILLFAIYNSFNCTKSILARYKNASAKVIQEKQNRFTLFRYVLFRIHVRVHWQGKHNTTGIQRGSSVQVFRKMIK